MTATTLARVEYSYRELQDMHRIDRKQLFRDILHQQTAVSIREMCELLGMTLTRPVMNCSRSGLVRKTMESLVADGTVDKNTEDHPITYSIPDGSEKPLIREERLFQRWEDALTTENGWFDFTDLEDLTGSVSPESVTDYLITPFIEYVNNRDKVWIQKSDHSGVPTYFVKGSESADRYEHLKDQVPGGT